MSARNKIAFEFEDKVDAHCRSERQWPRRMRILYAEANKQASKTPEDRKFWSAVIRRLEHD